MEGFWIMVERERSHTNWLRLLVPKDGANSSGYGYYGNCNYDSSHKRVSFTFNVSECQ